MDIIFYLYSLIDSNLMYFYRFPDSPMSGYFLGTFVLSFACVIVGKYSISFAFKANKNQIQNTNHEIDHFQKLSIEALKTGNKSAYKACNSIANDAFGKNFFSQIALSASSLWPVFFSLGWMQYRFSEIEFTLPFSIWGTDLAFGYLSTFLLCYIVSCFFFGRIRNKLPLLGNL